MQKQDLIPTPLGIGHGTRRILDLVEPQQPSRFRFLQIARFVVAILLRRIAKKLLGGWAKQRYSPEADARHLRAFMEQMGGLWVKAGQLVALRRDLFSEQFCTELGRLQDRARGFSGHLARQTIEAELGMPIDKVFSEFDETPLAAASIGQAHCGRLRKNGAEVVVKVRRPYIAEIIERDLRIVRNYVRFLLWAGVAPQLRWEDMYWELEHALLEELDYAQEAASLRRMRRNLRAHKIYVPKVFLQFCTDQVLVMEMVRGVYMSEYIQVAAKDPARVSEWLKENQINPRRAGQRILFSHYRQLFEDNLYHCDLHPGNILLMRRSYITLIDFGSVGSSDRTQLYRFLQLLAAVGSGDYYKAADLFLLMAPELPPTDLTEAKEQVVRVYRQVEPLTKSKSVPYHEKSVAKVASQIVEILGAVRVPASWDMLRSNRAELTLDASLMFLMPDIDYPKVIRKYLRQYRAREQKKLNAPKQQSGKLAMLIDSVDMPAKLVENAYFEGEYLRQRAIKYEGYFSKASRIGHSALLTVSRCLMVASVVAAILGLHQRFDALRFLHGTRLYELLQRLPPVAPAVWLVAVLTGIYASYEMLLMVRILEQPEAARVSGAS